MADADHDPYDLDTVPDDRTSLPRSRMVTRVKQGSSVKVGDVTVTIMDRRFTGAGVYLKIECGSDVPIEKV